MVEQSRASTLRSLDRAGRRLGFASTVRNQAAARLVGLHPTDWLALDLLDGLGPTPVGTLGRHLGLSRSAATAMVDRLESIALVARRSSDDRRVVEVVAVGDRGHDYDDVDRELREAMIAHAEAFDDRELQTVLRFLDGAADVLLATTDRMRERAPRRVE